jgi:hypothetical protein
MLQDAERFGRSTLTCIYEAFCSGTFVINPKVYSHLLGQNVIV